MTQLFDPSTTTSLGAAISSKCASVASKYSCASTSNCTSTELANLQWGQSYVTQNPVEENPIYTPKSTTTSNWGDYPVYGCSTPVEYFYWMADGSASLSVKTVQKVQSNRVDVFGLLALFNSQRLMSAYYTQNTVTLTKFTTILGVDSNFPTNCVLMVQGWLFEGAWRSYSTRELAYGWYSDLAGKANGGDFWSGADFNIEQWMTPIFTDQQGPMAMTHYGLFSGSFSIDNVSAYRLNNG